MKYLEELNEEQRKAVENTKGPSLVIAGAGSGKTRVLTYRIAHLLNQGVNPHEILALTFTNKAAKEMKKRIANIVDPQLANSIWMGTFHSIFSRILRYEAKALKFSSNFTIYDTQDAKNLIKSILKDLKLDDKTYKINSVLGRISMAKNNLVTSDAYANNTNIQAFDRSINMPRIQEIYKWYHHRCQKADAMDFDDLLLYTNILFRDNIDILEKYQEIFKYILVDEYQDTNYSQYLIVKKLAARHKNICVVGDDAQSIYSFRGAKIENILNFRNDYPGYSLYKLEQNYRSTPTIVNAANSVIDKNKEQIKKVSFSKKEEGENIQVIKALSDKEEGFKVACEIMNSIYNNHLKFNDFAILYRTNAQSRIFEESFRKRNIPYKIYGGLSFYSRKEIKDIISYFKLIVNSNDEEALKRVINYPRRGIGTATVEKLRIYSTNEGKSIWEIIQNLCTAPYDFNSGTIKKLTAFASLINSFKNNTKTQTAYELALSVASTTGIMTELLNDRTTEGISRHENIQELLNGIKDFTEISEQEDKDSSLPVFLEQVALLTDQDAEKPEDIEKVTLMTVHSAKGLEFKHVFIVGMEEELFPSKMSISTPQSLEEERRLFYVALTRAESKVSLSYTVSRYQWGNIVQCRPSRFLKEIDSQFIDLPEESLIINNEEDNNSFNYKNKPSTKQHIKLGARRLTPLQKANTLSNVNNNFQASNPNSLQAGMNVTHQRFGSGKILNIEGNGTDKKATVFFQNHGQKQLLLKFAKLKIIK